MGMLNFKYILKCLEAFKTETTIYLVLEYAPGGDMVEYLEGRKIGRKIGKIDEKDAIRFFRQMAQAVDYCHYKKVAHR